ncbi:hypothetical protein [Ramlibacter tataouinensis]|nr:hypothetical protein [Ramlibacter tataouinensis]
MSATLLAILAATCAAAALLSWRRGDAARDVGLMSAVGAAAGGLGAALAIAA